MITATFRSFVVFTCVSAGWPAQRAIVRDDGMRSPRKIEHNTGELSQSLVQGGQEVQVPNSEKLGSRMNHAIPASDRNSQKGSPNVDTSDAATVKDAGHTSTVKGEGRHTDFSIVEINGSEPEGEIPKLQAKKQQRDAHIQAIDGIKKSVQDERAKAKGQKLFSNAEAGLDEVLGLLKEGAGGALEQRQDIHIHKDQIVNIKDEFNKLLTNVTSKLDTMSAKFKAMAAGFDIASGLGASFKEISPDHFKNDNEHGPHLNPTGTEESPSSTSSGSANGNGGSQTNRSGFDHEPLTEDDQDE